MIHEQQGSADWRSTILDSHEEAMWDELRDLPTASQDAISGGSPVKNSDDYVHSLDPSDGRSPIGGDEQAPVAPFLGCGSTLDAVWAAGVASQPEAPARSKKIAKATSATRPLTWTNVAPEQMLDSAQLPNAGALQLRRQKNRDCMRRARQRQREQLKEMKSTVSRLEKQYADMCLRATTDDDAALIGSSALSINYSQGTELVKRLGAENLYLKAEIQQQATWKLHLYSILESRPEMDGPRWAQQFQQPALGGAEALRVQLDRLDEYEAAQVFGFHPLTELELTRVILDNNRAMGRVQNRLLPPSSLDGTGRTRTRRMLEATGYVLGTQSVDSSGSHLQDEPDDKVAWAYLSLSIEFLNVVNPATDEEYQQLRWTGRTDYAERNTHIVMPLTHCKACCVGKC